MNQFEEGYIKFHCHWQESQHIIPSHLFSKVDQARSEMMNRRLIGCYDNGIGFGNISIRDTESPDRFFITGSATGHIQTGTPAIYALVERWDIASNTLWCSGPVKASSESMSHAVIYATMPEVRCVIHIHSMDLWQRNLERIPCTPSEAAYGTPEMAHSIEALIVLHHMTQQGLLAMKGHEEGIIMYGRSPEEAIEVYEQLLNT